MPDNILHLLGYASGIAGANPGSSDGPLHIKQSDYLSMLENMGLKVQWDSIVDVKPQNNISKLEIVANGCRELASSVLKLTSHNQFFTVLGGDHSCAIGTWSGAAHAFRQKGELGLIWIDAHMDSHTFETTPTGNIHGMPLACLLGHGDVSLTNILDNLPKFKPQHVCLIGVRSFEEGEATLLENLNVRIFFMEEVKKRGLSTIMQEALQIAMTDTAGFGVSLDIDSIDPQDAPGTGVAEPDGIGGFELCKALSELANNKKLVGIEITEFNPHRDKNRITEKLIIEMLAAIKLGKLITC